MKIKSLLFVVAVAVALVSCGGGGGMPKFGDDEYPVQTIGSSSASMQTTYPATIKGIQDVEVRPKVSGFITKVYVHEGQAVSAGQVLFSIDSETYRAVVQQAQAGLNTANAQLNTARLTYENNKKLFEKNVIGQYELSTAQNTFATAQASVSQAQAALASAKEQLSWCQVKSPSAGVIGSLPFKVGALVSASSALTTVSEIGTVEVFFSMSESQMLSLTKTAGNVNAAIKALPAVKLQLADGTLYNHPGKIVKASGVIDPSTGSLSLIAHFANPERLLKSGGAGQIIIPNDNNAVIQVPQEACSEVQDKIFVYKVGKDNKVVYSEIKVDPQNDGNNYIVTSGLNVGDRIVVKGITKLTDGMDIKPITIEAYQKKLEKAAKLAEGQSTAKGFIDAMKSK
ncbi:efflux RND transporter periplasmic adaptor subunit [Segatella baroniae]|uniref:efflux RND transporter periplasmic adaptor subunit n=1 Tax=Segatella baroniae TaxID=305719 RepID=UPI000409390E|nr:efflux RND transporter periplasmic adaptor subunit [Segatella baroniae]